jgi:SWI/SNF-related matrix-associated actin-dependent regulator of chromatin subfamily A member 5
VANENETEVLLSQYSSCGFAQHYDIATAVNIAESEFGSSRNNDDDGRAYVKDQQQELLLEGKVPDEQRIKAENLRVQSNQKIIADLHVAKSKRIIYFAKHLDKFSPFISDRLRLALAQISVNSEPQRVVPLTEHPTYVSSARGILQTYQIDGINWMRSLHSWAVGGILADEMGLGKTLQVISFLASLKKDCNIHGPHLVVCPLSVLQNWIDEFQCWCPGFRVIKFHGNADERARLAETVMDLGTFDVICTTFETITSKDSLKFFQGRLVWQYLIVDEAHRLKNDRSILFGALSLLTCFNCIFLTGTPIQNNLHELWAMLNFLFPTLFTSSESFDRFFDASGKPLNGSSILQIDKLLLPIMLRREKDSVLTGLPPKTETKIFIRLSAIQIEYYTNLLRAFCESPQVKGAHLRLLSGLRKVCNHPFLLSKEADSTQAVSNSISTQRTNLNDDQFDIEMLIASSGKFVVLDKLLRKIQAEGHRTLIFSQFSHVLDLLGKLLVARGYKFARLDGSTNRVRRKVDIRRFNEENSPLSMFLISTRAGGLGINLATADTVILFDSDFNPQNDLQAMARAHRIGQQKPVHVYRLIAEETIEEHIMNKIDRKLYLDAIVNGRRRIDWIGKVDENEVMTLILFGADRICRQSASSSINEDDISEIISRSQQKSIAFQNQLCTASVDSRVSIKEARHSAANFDFNQFDGKKITEFQGKTFLKKVLVDDTKKDKPNFQPLDRSFRQILVNLKLDDDELYSPDCSESSSLNEINVDERNENSQFKEHEDECFVCSDGGRLLCCLYCPHVYHLECLNLTKEPSKFICPQHSCVKCCRSTSAAGGLLFRCLVCPCAYCEDHVPDARVETDRNLVSSCLVSLSIFILIIFS